MKTFKELLKEELLNEIGDTKAGREAIARYLYKSSEWTKDATKRAFKFYDRASDVPTLKQAHQMRELGAGLVRTRRYGNRMTGQERADKILRGAPGAEFPRLRQIRNHG